MESAERERFGPEVRYESGSGEILVASSGAAGEARLGIVLGAWDSRNPGVVAHLRAGKKPGHLQVVYPDVEGMELTIRCEVLGSGVGIHFAIRSTGPEACRLHTVGVEGVLEGDGPVEAGSIRQLDGMCGGGFTTMEKLATHSSDNNLCLTYKSGHSGRRQTIVAGGLGYEDFGKRADLSVDASSGEVKIAILAEDAVGRLIEPGEVYSPKDAFYLDVLEADPFESLERYGYAVREFMQADPNPYDFLTVCGWYASMSIYGAGAYINNSTGLVKEAATFRKSELAKYTDLACRLVPDTYSYESL
ncbi:MAG: hypothetical protein AB3N33_10630, partial [Puniceicoccaceae bacterium]